MVYRTYRVTLYHHIHMAPGIRTTSLSILSSARGKTVILQCLHSSSLSGSLLGTNELPLMGEERGGGAREYIPMLGHDVGELFSLASFCMCR